MVEDSCSDVGWLWLLAGERRYETGHGPTSIRYAGTYIYLALMLYYYAECHMFCLVFYIGHSAKNTFFAVSVLPSVAFGKRFVEFFFSV